MADRMPTLAREIAAMTYSLTHDQMSHAFEKDNLPVIGMKAGELAILEKA